MDGNNSFNAPCTPESCAELKRLAQQIDDIRAQNGNDHKDMRERLSKVETDIAKQHERFDRIMDNIGDLKGDTRELLVKVGNLSSQAKDIEMLEKDIDEIKGRDGKTWADIKSKLISLIVALIFGIVIAALGLSQFR